MSPAERPLTLSELKREAASFLLETVRRDGLFPYSTTVRGGTYVNDFDHPAAVRYSINSLLGLQAEALHGSGVVDRAEVSTLTETFLEHHADDVSSPADIGLLLVLLCEGEVSAWRAEKLLGRIGSWATKNGTPKLTMQEASWMLWGACAAARAGTPAAADTAGQLAELILGRFLEPSSGLARHSLGRYRRDLVSFGATAYFLRSLFEFARLSGDERAQQAFERGVEVVVGLQGELGEWPWLISVRRRVVLDVYPVFTVHQDSMSMLFLLPALESGLDVEGAIGRSFAWALGRNELAAPMFERDRFAAYRSIERAESLPRARRYLRATARSRTGGADRGAHGSRVRLNRECRSYHLGWILYVWSGRDAVPGLPDATAAS